MERSHCANWHTMGSGGTNDFSTSSLGLCITFLHCALISCRQCQMAFRNDEGRKCSSIAVIKVLWPTTNACTLWHKSKKQVFLPPHHQKILTEQWEKSVLPVLEFFIQKLFVLNHVNHHTITHQGCGVWKNRSWFSSHE